MFDPELLSSFGLQLEHSLYLPLLHISLHSTTGHILYSFIYTSFLLYKKVFIGLLLVRYYITNCMKPISELYLLLF